MLVVSSYIVLFVHQQVTMKVNVAFNNWKTSTVNVGSGGTVWNLKEVVGDKEGIPPEQIRLYNLGEQLEDVRSLSSYRITNGGTVQATLKLKGGR